MHISLTSALEPINPAQQQLSWAFLASLELTVWLMDDAFTSVTSLIWLLDAAALSGSCRREVWDLIKLSDALVIKSCPLLISCFVVFVHTALPWLLLKFALTSAWRPAESNTNILTLDGMCTCQLSATQQVFPLHALSPLKTVWGFLVMQAHQIESEIIRKVTLRQELFGCEAHFLPYLKHKEQRYLGRAVFTILSMLPPPSRWQKLIHTAPTVLSLFLLLKVQHNSYCKRCVQVFKACSCLKMCFLFFTCCLVVG